MIDCQEKELVEPSFALFFRTDLLSSQHKGSSPSMPVVEEVELRKTLPSVPSWKADGECNGKTGRRRLRRFARIFERFRHQVFEPSVRFPHDPSPKGTLLGFFVRQCGLQAGPQLTGRPNHALGWRAFGSEEVEGARSGQSLLASGLRQARRNEGIARSHPRSPHEACWHLGGKQADGTDGFPVLCHQFTPSSLSRQESCLTSFKTF